MPVYFLRFFSVLMIAGTLVAGCSSSSVDSSAQSSAAQSGTGSAASKSPVSSTSPMNTGEQTAVFAGGCFWGMEAVFEHVKGVSDVTSGFSYGRRTVSSANREADSSAGKNGYAEAVKITFDSSKITYRELLKVFFLAAHDPTELNRQGPDVGTEYRSVIFYASDEQKQMAESYIAELTAAKHFPNPIVTEIAELDVFNKAEAEHQDYMVRHPDEPYIVENDKPKLEELRRQFGDLYISK